MTKLYFRGNHPRSTIALLTEIRDLCHNGDHRLSAVRLRTPPVAERLNSFEQLGFIVLMPSVAMEIQVTDTHG